MVYAHVIQTYIQCVVVRDGFIHTYIQCVVVRAGFIHTYIQCVVVRAGFIHMYIQCVLVRAGFFSHIHLMCIYMQVHMLGYSSPSSLAYRAETGVIHFVLSAAWTQLTCSGFSSFSTVFIQVF